MNDEYDWMDEAREIAAQIWCDKRVETRVMDVELAEIIAEKIAAWMQTAAQNQRNTDYYRGLLEQCGNIIGDRAFIADDGTRTDDVLCAKIPEIIAADYDKDEAINLIANDVFLAMALEKVTNEELVKWAISKYCDYTMHPVVEEMMNRLHPGWECKDEDD